jgi:hypothetical protein
VSESSGRFAPEESNRTAASQITNITLALVLLFAIAMNVWSAIQLNRAYDRIDNIFCVEDRR